MDIQKNLSITEPLFSGILEITKENFARNVPNASIETSLFRKLRVNGYKNWPKWFRYREVLLYDERKSALTRCKLNWLFEHISWWYSLITEYWIILSLLVIIRSFNFWMDCYNIIKKSMRIESIRIFSVSIMVSSKKL